MTQKDRPPYDGARPTRRWPVGQPLDLEVALQLPERLPYGRYYLAVGWHDPTTGARLPTAGSTALAGGDRVLIDVEVHDEGDA